MAKSNQGSKLPLKVSAAANRALEGFTKSSNKIVSSQLGAPQNLIDLSAQNEKLANSINSTIVRTYNDFVGLGSDHNAQEINQILTLSKKNAATTKTNVKEQLEKFKKSVGGNETAAAVVQQRKNYKASLYSSYDLILGVIPKMKMAVKTIANSIISPDDFSKRSFSIRFDESRMNKQAIAEAKSQLDTLTKKYKLDENLAEEVSDTLVKGERFFAILSLNDQIRTLLKEQVTSTPDSGYRTLQGTCKMMLSEATATPEENFLLDEGMAIFNEGRKEDNKFNKDNFANSLDEFFTNNFVIGDSSHLLNEHVETQNELTEAQAFQVPTAMKSAASNTATSEASAAADGLRMSSDSAVLKRLSPDCVVKLEFEDQVYGYIYLDTIEAPRKANEPGRSGATGGDQSMTANTVTSAVQSVLYSANDIDRGIGGGAKNNLAFNDPKLSFIADMFANRLSQKENIRLIKKSEQLKYVIYHSLLTKRITKDEKVRVLFFTPDEIVHIDRKESIFDNILFFAKLYIATLITLLMQNVVRGADKRAYYVDIGLENDAANAVNDVIRTVKAKDVSNIHDMDITSVMNMLSEFNDYYIPTIDGEKPITIDTVEGLSNVSLDNDFLNWLSNNIFSGIGLPSAYLTEVENVDFAKTLAMQNSRFIRDIISEQRIFGNGYSEIYRKLYKREFGNSSNTNLDKSAAQKKANDANGDRNNDGSTAQIDIESIVVAFPSPVSLNMTNLNDQLNNLNMLVDSMAELIEVPKDDLDTAKPIFKLEMYRKFLSNLDWEEMDSVMKIVKQKLVTTKIKNPSAASGDGGGDPSDDGGEGEDGGDDAGAAPPDGGDEAPQGMPAMP
jgi:hypothetical protein